MDAILNDLFLQNVTRTAGCSNIAVISRDDKRIVQAALTHIHELLQGVDHSEEDRLLVQALEDQLKVAIAPHKALPAEILARVFSELVPVSTLPHSSWRHEERHEPMSSSDLDISLWNRYEPRRIRTVCSRWRQIALNHYSLWSNVLLEWPPSTQLPGTSLRALINRAPDILPDKGPIALYLAVTHFYVNPMTLTGIFEDNIITRMVLPLAQRLQSLTVRSHMEELTSLFDLPLETTFPILKSLNISVTHEMSGLSDQDPHATTTRGTIFSRSPTLQNVDVSVGRYQPLVFSSLVSWSQLTRLRLSEPAQLDLLLLALADSPNLSSLSVTCLPGPSPSSPNPIVLLNLEELELSMSPGSEILLDFLQVPALTRVSLICAPSPAIQKMTALIGRSACAIKAFEDGWGPQFHPSLSTEGFDQLLARMPQLQELYTGAVLEESVVRSVGSGALLPHLEVLSCMSSQKFAEALESGLADRDHGAPPRTQLRSAICKLTQAAHEGEWEDEVMLKRVEELEMKYGIKLELSVPFDFSFFDEI